MGLFSHWSVSYRPDENYRWRLSKVKFKRKPSVEKLEETFQCGGQWLLRKIFMGKVVESEIVTSDLEPNYDFAYNGVKSRQRKGKMIKLGDIEVPESLLEDSNKIQNLGTLVKVARVPSQDVVDFAAKVDIVRETVTNGGFDDIILHFLDLVTSREERRERMRSIGQRKRRRLSGAEEYGYEKTRLPPAEENSEGIMDVTVKKAGGGKPGEIRVFRAKSSEGKQETEVTEEKEEEQEEPEEQKEKLEPLKLGSDEGDEVETKEGKEVCTLG